MGSSEKSSSSQSEQSTAPTGDASSSSWLPSSMPSWSSFRHSMDNQRLHRLEQCKALAATLRACQRGDSDRPQLEDFSTGIRSVKFFSWRRDDPHNQTHTDEDEATRLPADPGCLRETHALWACRSTALGCGSPLVQLRDCFREHTAAQLLTSPGTAYTDDDGHHNKKDAGKNIPCSEYQRNVSECVARNAKALAQRQDDYRQQQQQK